MQLTVSWISFAILKTAPSCLPFDIYDVALFNEKLNYLLQLQRCISNRGNLPISEDEPLLICGSSYKNPSAIRLQTPSK